MEEELNLIEDDQKEVEEQISNVEDNLFQMPSDSIEKNLENNDNEELNPEECDPW